MRTRMIVISAAAAVCLAGCTSSGDGASTATPTQPSTPVATSPAATSPVASGPAATSPAPTSETTRPSVSTSSASRRPSSSASKPAAPTARSYLLTSADVGGGFQATTQVDASIPLLCGGGGRADRGKPYRSTAQVGYFDSSRRVLVAEKVNVYADRAMASQIGNAVLAFDSCGSAARYNGLKATYTPVFFLDGQDLVSSSAARNVTTSQAHVTFVALRAGTTLVQLTFTSLGGAPPRALVDAITVKAARRLK